MVKLAICTSRTAQPHLHRQTKYGSYLVIHTTKQAAMLGETCVKDAEREAQHCNSICEAGKGDDHMQDHAQSQKGTQINLKPEAGTGRGCAGRLW